MITRSNLAEQLREYQIRSKHDWASVSFFSSTSSFSSSRVDVVVFVIWELVILAFLVFSAVSLYFKRLQLAFILTNENYNIKLALFDFQWTTGSSFVLVFLLFGFGFRLRLVNEKQYNKSSETRLERAPPLILRVLSNH
ncbi:hypothetical protein YC2023_058330 [Brassica napus]|uniref:Uncharacterized protein n=2 Tax=Brassica oleracea TaxID=3712 RepID=A0A0D3CBS1_BRAOL|nr:unnamed protein product [Brassica oleracea]